MSYPKSEATIIDESLMEGEASIPRSPSPREVPADPTELESSLPSRVHNHRRIVDRLANLIVGLSNRVNELETNMMNTSGLLREALNEVQSLKMEASVMRNTIAELQGVVRDAKRGRDGTVGSVDRRVDERWCAKEGRMRLKVSVGWSWWKR